jgi:YD repeat-containing protein
MKTKKFILIFLLSLCSIQALSAYNDGLEVHDLLYNKKITYKTKYQTLNNSKINFYEELDVSIPILIDLKDSNLQKKLNKRFETILVSQLESDSFKLKINAHCKESVHMYLYNDDRGQDDLGLYQDNETRFTPELSGVKHEFRSYHNGILVFQAVFKYQAVYSRYKLEKFEYTQTYYINVNTGKEYHASSIYNLNKLKQFNELIEKKISLKLDNYVQQKKRINEDHSDFYEEAAIEYLQSKKPMKVSGFSALKNGYIFPKIFSFAYYIPEWQSCMYNTGGLDAEIRLNFEEIKPFLNPNGPYGSLINATNPKETIDFIFPNKNIINTYNIPRIETKINLAFLEEMPKFYAHNIKTIIIKQKERYTKKDTAIPFREISISKSGQVIEKINFSSGKKYYSETYLFDSLGRLIKISEFKKELFSEAFDFTYNAKGNILSSTQTNKPTSDETRYYYYKDNMCFIESYAVFNGKTDIDYYRFSFTDSGYLKDKKHYNPNGSSNGNNYLYKNRKILYVTSSYTYKAPEEGTHFVYNDSGLLISIEYDDDQQYNYAYDDKARIVSETRYYRDKQSSSKTITYNEQGEIEKVIEEMENNNPPLIYYFEYIYW